MNTTSTRIYERLRKRSLRAKYLRRSRRQFVNDKRSTIGNDRARWYSDHHAAYVKGVKDALNAVETESHKLDDLVERSMSLAYEQGLEEGAAL